MAEPLPELTTVAISPSITTYKLTYCSVILPSGLFVSNMISEVSSVQFDAEDGQGYRALQFNVPLNLSYADTGWKHWQFRISLIDGRQLYSHSKVHFNNTSNMAGSNGIATRGIEIDRRRNIIATESYNGVLGVADIIISYGNANDQVLRRPLIIAEGLDPGHITNPEEPEGANTFTDFIISVANSGSATLRNLISNNPSHYDIVYINWRNGTDWLQRNALVLEEVIRWVNANKQPDLTTGLLNQNVVLGSSMGGVIARMALGRMDRNGGVNAHQTRLYVSLDAPHQGANVPLGYQAAARHGARMYLNTGAAVVSTVETVQLILGGASPLQSLFLIDQPAVRQLLTRRMDIFYNQANTENQNFMNELRTQWAYPVNIRNIAISNGSECGIDQEFAAGSSLLYHYRSTKTRFIGDLIAMATGPFIGGSIGAFFGNVAPVIGLTLPGSNKFELTLDVKALANTGGNQVYYGNIKLTKKVLWLVSTSINIANKTYTAPTGLLPFDTYPGGFYTVGISNQLGSVSQDWMFNYDNSFFIQRRFSFIPTTSALDIGQGNTLLTNNDYLAKYIGGTPPLAPLNTPFNNFATAFNANPITLTGTNPAGQTIYQFTSNGDEPHEGLFIRSSNWLAEELNGNNNVRANCSFVCNSPAIQGPPSMCTSANYTIPGIAGTGATVSWSVSPTNLTTAPYTGTGNAFNVTRNGSATGTITLTATITSICSANPVVLNKTITIGGAGVSLLSSQGNCNGTVKTWSLSTTPASNGSNWQWTVDYLGTNSSIYIYNSNASSTYVDVTGGGTVKLTYTDLCGTTRTDGVTVYSNCRSGFGFAVTPNPTQDNVKVSSDNQTLTKNSSPNLIYAIKITDRFGIIRKSFEYKPGIGSVNISVSDLNSGLYLIAVFDGTNWSNQQLVVQK